MTPEAMSMDMAIQEREDISTEGLCMWVQSHLCGCKLTCALGLWKQGLKEL